jgi:cell division protein FtsB
MDENLIKDIKPKSPTWKFIKKWILNKYFISIFLFLIWMTFFDNNSFLVINDLNSEIKKCDEHLAYYKSEYQKNDDFYKKLMNNKAEKEKFARENYFMKKPNEEIFILVADSSGIKKHKKN